MKVVLLLGLFLFVACASQPKRDLASEDLIFFGDIKASNSKVRLYPPHAVQDDLHHFYLELRNDKNKLVDVALEDIRVKQGKKIITSRVKRLTLGKYELEIAHDVPSLKDLKFLVQGKSLQHQLLKLQRPDKHHSRIKIISNEAHVLKLQLSLRDKQNRRLDTGQVPEIILDGLFEISFPELVDKGVWEFTIQYPEANQIFYLSIRANGILLERLFRFQHVEK